MSDPVVTPQEDEAFAEAAERQASLRIKAASDAARLAAKLRVGAAYCKDGQMHRWEQLDNGVFGWYCCSRPGCLTQIRMEIT